MFTLHSNYKPCGDQPEAIRQLSQGVLAGRKFQTLLGVTGSGKTFTMANVIKEMKKPCLVGTKVATKILHDGDRVEVDANKGIIKILK